VVRLKQIITVIQRGYGGLKVQIKPKELDAMGRYCVTP
jgi:hypothetical protein